MAHTKPSDPIAPTTTSIPYLAYGSNLASSTFRGRRGISPLSSHVVYVPTLELVFDLPGIPYLEPRFANVKLITSSDSESKADGKTTEETPLLHATREDVNKATRGELPESEDDGVGKKGLYGVVYYVTPEDYAKIVATEGGGTSYEDVMVDCVVLPKSALAPSDNEGSESTEQEQEQPAEPVVISAHTLLAPRSKTRQVTPQGHPSPRYLTLLTKGAAEHNMPPKWQSYLSSLPTFTATTIRQRIGRLVFMGVWMPTFMTFFLLGRVVVDKEGRAPGWWGGVTSVMFGTVWCTYDGFFRNLFGEGERGVGHEEGKESWAEGEVEAIEDAVEGGMGGQ